MGSHAQAGVTETGRVVGGDEQVLAARARLQLVSARVVLDIEGASEEAHMLRVDDLAFLPVVDAVDLGATGDAKAHSRHR